MNINANVFEPYSAQYQQILAYRARLAGCTGHLIEHKKNAPDMQDPSTQRAFHIIAQQSMFIDYQLKILEANMVRTGRYTRTLDVSHAPNTLNSAQKKQNERKKAPRAPTFASAMRNNNVRALAAILAENTTQLDKIVFQPHLALELVAYNARCTQFLMNHLRNASEERRNTLFKCSFTNNKSFVIMHDAGVPRRWLSVSDMTVEQKAYLESIGFVDSDSDSDTGSDSDSEHEEIEAGSDEEIEAGDEHEEIEANFEPSPGSGCSIS